MNSKLNVNRPHGQTRMVRIYSNPKEAEETPKQKKKN